MSPARPLSQRERLTVIVVVELHAEVDVAGQSFQVLHEQEELSDEQHRGVLGVVQGHLHLYILVPVGSGGNVVHTFS